MSALDDIDPTDHVARLKAMERKLEASRQACEEERARANQYQRQLGAVRAGVDNVWLWQGDRGDAPESLVCPVVMEAETLRAMLKLHAEAESCVTSLLGIAKAQSELMSLSWDDRPLPEDKEIEAAFPTRSGNHEAYGEAMRLVGACRSKGRLVALVNWLLTRRDEATCGEYAAEEGFKIVTQARDAALAKLRAAEEVLRVLHETCAKRADEHTTLAVRSSGQLSELHGAKALSWESAEDLVAAALTEVRKP